MLLVVLWRYWRHWIQIGCQSRAAKIQPFLDLH